jgi:predicted transposase YdaD
VLRLPEDLDRRFRQELRHFEEEKQMPYITSVDRLGREEGRQEGRQDGRQEGLREGLLAGIELALKLKFGEAGQAVVPEIRALADPSVIQGVYARIEEVRQAYR